MLGVVLIYMSVIVTMSRMSSRTLMSSAPVSLLAGAIIATYMLFSFCAGGNSVGAFIIAMFAPVVVGVFAMQVDSFTNAVL